METKVENKNFINHKLPKSLTTITPFSKLLAMFLFILFPFVGFYLGYNYNKSLNYSNNLPINNYTSPTQTTDETANWKTYVDNIVGFSIKYPSDWNIVKDSQYEPNEDSYFLTSPDYKEIKNFQPFQPFFSKGSRFSIVTQLNENFKSYEDYKKILEKSASGDTKGYINEKEIYIESVKALLLTGGKPFGDSSYQASLYTYAHGRTWDLNIISLDNQEKFFEQILSTFKFTDSNRTVDYLNFMNRIKTAVLNNDANALANLQTQVPFKCFTIGQYEPAMCKSLKDGQTTNAYMIGVLNSDNTPSTKNELVIRLSTYLRKDAPFNFLGEKSNQEKAILAFTSADNKDVLIFYATNQKNNWEIISTITGFNYSFDVNKQSLNFDN